MQHGRPDNSCLYAGVPRADQGMNREGAPGKSPEEMYIQQKVRVLLMLRKMGSNLTASEEEFLRTYAGVVSSQLSQLPQHSIDQGLSPGWRQRLDVEPPEPPGGPFSFPSWEPRTQPGNGGDPFLGLGEEEEEMEYPVQDKETTLVCRGLGAGCTVAAVFLAVPGEVAPVALEVSMARFPSSDAGRDPACAPKSAEMYRVFPWPQQLPGTAARPGHPRAAACLRQLGCQPPLGRR
ncbi:hypothetical protein J1605_000757 [Eschrichtius robustus]|uniref:Beta-catenin-interacting protein 1 n=1 Tax=Eschrichtius robustus TaxID=9764 RepID=A0AB34GMP8_ESCRO|nr:hypothetical protein J1605_000757 [Eschrichtius robustus]